MKYRRRFDIIADVIGVARPSAKKTKIMYFANLSYALLKKYLEDSVRLGFLRFSGDEYEATSKGEAFLEHYAQFSNNRSRVNKDLEELEFEAEVLERMCRPGNARGKNARRRAFAALR